jgi:hypothetical protein
MRIISFIEDPKIIIKILQKPAVVGCQTQTASVRQSAEGGPEAFIVWDESSPPGPDDPASLMKLRRTGYIIDVDYPMDLSRRSSTCWVEAESEAQRAKSDLSRRSSKNEDGS